MVFKLKVNANCFHSTKLSIWNFYSFSCLNSIYVVIISKAACLCFIVLKVWLIGQRNSIFTIFKCFYLFCILNILLKSKSCPTSLISRTVFWLISARLYIWISSKVNSNKKWAKLQKPSLSRKCYLHLFLVYYRCQMLRSSIQLQCISFLTPNRCWFCFGVLHLIVSLLLFFDVIFFKWEMQCAMCILNSSVLT